MRILKGETFNMNLQLFIKTFVKMIKEKYNFDGYISDDLKDWTDEINKALENTVKVEETENKIVYTSFIETRLFGKLIYEPITIKYCKGPMPEYSDNDIEFLYYL